MLNWFNPKVIFIVFVGFFLGQQNPLFTAQVRPLRHSVTQNYLIANQTVENISECQKLNIAYQEIYSFETENYYINVCQLESSFYYYRQAKFDRNNILLIPAQAIFSGDTFQAFEGKTTYFVGKDGDRHYSSVMLNNHEIVFEPELQLPASSLSQGE